MKRELLALLTVITLVLASGCANTSICPPGKGIHTSVNGTPAFSQALVVVEF